MQSEGVKALNRRQMLRLGAAGAGGLLLSGAASSQILTSTILPQPIIEKDYDDPGVAWRDRFSPLYEFVPQWRSWYISLQPACRGTDWPLKTLDCDKEDFGELRKGGKTGFATLLIIFVWWREVSAVGHDEEHIFEVFGYSFFLYHCQYYVHLGSVDG